MSLENRLRWISLILLMSGLGISIYFRRQADQQGGRVSPREEGSLLLTLRTIIGLGMWLSVLIFLVKPRWMAWSQYPAPTWLRWGALGLMALSLPFLYWLFRSLGNNITKTVSIRDEHQLVTSGPYRWIRHPLYTFGFVFFISFSVMAASWFMLLVMLIGFSIIAVRTPIEEAKQIEEFGDEYREYMRRTARYLPQLKANHSE